VPPRATAATATGRRVPLARRRLCGARRLRRRSPQAGRGQPSTQHSHRAAAACSVMGGGGGGGGERVETPARMPRSSAPAVAPAAAVAAAAPARARAPRAPQLSPPAPRCRPLPAANRCLVDGTTAAAHQPPHRLRSSVSGKGKVAAKVHGGNAATVRLGQVRRKQPLRRPPPPLADAVAATALTRTPTRARPTEWESGRSRKGRREGRRAHSHRSGDVGCQEDARLGGGGGHQKRKDHGRRPAEGRWGDGGARRRRSHCSQPPWAAPGAHAATGRRRRTVAGAHRSRTWDELNQAGVAHVRPHGRPLSVLE